MSEANASKVFLQIAINRSINVYHATRITAFRPAFCIGTTLQQLRIVLAAILSLYMGTTWTYAEESSPFPPEDDPSHFTGSALGDLPEDLPDANEGAFGGGDTGTASDAATDNVLQEKDQRDDGIFNVPTNGPPSPLFNVRPFTQQMLRFEEFGTRHIKLGKKIKRKNPGNWRPLPAPPDARSAPDSAELEAFLAQKIWPIPTRYSNDRDLNPWQSEIESYLGRPLVDPPAEGRPPGQGWSHQRWEEFKPEVFFQTAQAGARTNGGFRDIRQMHKYRTGEFGPGGLYHNTTGRAGFDGTTSGIEVRFHPDMPIQHHTALWTFDGTFPPKLLNVRYGEPVLMRHYNALPIDVSANRGFGIHTLSTHEHNGHNPAESDGYTNSFFFPGQFYDYRWPMVLAGYDSINTNATDPRAGTPHGRANMKIPGDWRETMSTHWFHDHMLDFTAQNVYKGNAAMMNYYSALDRGNEEIDDGVNLRLPSGTALGWGNRDYDVNLILADKAWDGKGQLWFNPFNLKGFIGDVMTANWLYKPYLDVRARKYRFRLLNGSVSRYFKIGLMDQSGNPVPFYMVANDGNIMEHMVYFPNGELPTQGVAERYDIIVDFSDFNPGDKLYMVNLLQHKNGQSTDVAIPMADLSTYNPQQADCDDDGTIDCWVDGDPVVGAFLEFRVHAYSGTDLSMEPADYVAGGQKMIPLRKPTEEEVANALHRTFEFERQPTDDRPWVIETDGGKGFGMDPRRISAAPSKNSGGLEVWRLLNSGTWSHPVHIHFEEGIILRRDGVAPPEWEKWARKDVYRIGPQPDSGDMVEIALRFREFAGTYMEHCHNTQHEDHAMLLRWDNEHPGQVKLMPTPIPTWDGVSYVDSVALPTFRSGDTVGDDALGELPSMDSISVWNQAVIGQLGNIRNEFIGDALNPNENNERGTATFALQKGINIDADGNEREVFFFLHDVSNEELAGEMNLAWAGRLKNVPVAATAEATVTKKDNMLEWTFHGDLPNPVWANPPCRISDSIDPGSGEACPNPDGIPDVDDKNTYSPLRRVSIDGKEVIFNAIMVKWGDESWEQSRIDESCVSFPDVDGPTGGANGTCAYNGTAWGRIDKSGHVVAMDTMGPNPYVTFKLHKSWAGDGDYLAYYIVLDTYPAGPARAMGVPYVPKHQHLADAAVPLVQFVPGRRIHPTFPPMPQPDTTNGGEGDLSDGFGIIDGGGPFGSQVGLPSYFMPEDNYSPMWHIGFAHWLKPADRVIKGFKELKQAREDGELEILEWPAPPRIAEGDNTGIRVDDYDFDNPDSPHVVNCPTPMTIDRVVHNARLKLLGIPTE